MEQKSEKSPLLAGILSGLLPGLGQFYNRQWGKGIGSLVVFFLLASALASSYDPQELQRAAIKGKQPGNIEILMSLALFLLGLVVWSIVDAFRTAKGTR